MKIVNKSQGRDSIVWLIHFTGTKEPDVDRGVYLTGTRTRSEAKRRGGEAVRYYREDCVLALVEEAAEKGLP